MSGFKNFLLRGNLVDLAVAVIIGTSFGAVVTTFTAWLTAQMPESAVGVLHQHGELLRRVPQRRDLVRDPGGGRLLPRGAALHPAKEQFFPSPAPGTPEDVTSSRRSATSCVPVGPPDRRASPAQPWWGGTCARSHVSPGSPPAVRRRTPRGPARPSWSRQHVAEDGGQPPAALPVGLVPCGPVGHAQRPAASASACASSELSPDGEPPGEPEASRTAPEACRSRAARPR